MCLQNGNVHGSLQNGRLECKWSMTHPAIIRLCMVIQHGMCYINRLQHLQHCYNVTIVSMVSVYTNMYMYLNCIISVKLRVFDGGKHLTEYQTHIDEGFFSMENW